LLNKGIFINLRQERKTSFKMADFRFSPRTSKCLLPWHRSVAPPEQPYCLCNLRSHGFVPAYSNNSSLVFVTKAECIHFK